MTEFQFPTEEEMEERRYYSWPPLFPGGTFLAGASLAAWYSRHHGHGQYGGYGKYSGYGGMYAGHQGQMIDPPRSVRFLSPFPKSVGMESAEDPGFEAPSDYERLLGRHKMLLSLIGVEELNARIERLFPYKLERNRMVILLDESESATLGDFVRLFGSIDRLYKLLLTLVHKGYFIERWLRNAAPDFAHEDLLLVESIVKRSPGEIQVSAIGEAARALGDVLSIGKQVTDFRTAGVKVEEAKLELERKKRELDEEDRRRRQQATLADLDLEIEREKKLLELEQLRTKRDEEQRKRQRQLLEDIDQRLELLSKGIKVLSEVPEEVKLELKAAFFAELEIVDRTPLKIKSLEVISDKGTRTSKN